MVYMRPKLFWDVTQRRFIVTYQHFGKTYRSHLQWSSRQVGMLDYACWNR